MMFRAALYLHCASMFIATLATEEIDLGDYYASDPVQILFGRHRDWENIRPIHFIIFGALFFALIAMYMYYLKWRYQELSESAREFPDIEFIRFAWFSIAPGIQRYCEMDKMKAEVEKKILLPEDAGVGTLEWSSKPILNPLLNSVKATEIINFRDFASKAHIMVEHLVIQRLPHMRCSNFRTIENFIKAVKEEFHLDGDAARTYVELYEEARFGLRSVPFDDVKFNRFSLALVTLMKGLRSGWSI